MSATAESESAQDPSKETFTSPLGPENGLRSEQPEIMIGGQLRERTQDVTPRERQAGISPLDASDPEDKEPVANYAYSDGDLKSIVRRPEKRPGLLRRLIKGRRDIDYHDHKLPS